MSDHIAKPINNLFERQGKYITWETENLEFHYWCHLFTNLNRKATYATRNAACFSKGDFEVNLTCIMLNLAMICRAKIAYIIFHFITK